MRWLAAVLLVALGCDGADPDPGLSAGLRVPGAQPVVGALRGGDGPAVTAIEIRTPLLRAGQGQYLLAGRAGPGAAAVHVGRQGDARYWIVPTGLADVTLPDELTWSARFDVGAGVPDGPLVVQVRAVDAGGRPGPLSEARFTVGGPPDGALVVDLAWDGVADLDLYIVDPLGRRLGPDDPNTYAPPAPGAPPDGPDAWRQEGILDRDAGAGCRAEGPMAERARWAEAPPRGRYTVFVDLAATCGRDRIPWQIKAFAAGAEVLTAGGVLFPADGERSVGGGGVGLRVGEFELP
ncbi:MAG: hypothetical protein H6706_10765 [Myxococcales bacterium]|nr:hypothetical protein [Myxococcales bacterium]